MAPLNMPLQPFVAFFLRVAVLADCFWSGDGLDVF